MPGPSNLPPGVSNDDVERAAGWAPPINMEPNTWIPMGFHRTADRTCSGCRYWSEMIAQYGGGKDGAMCLSSTSAHKGQYTSRRQTCPQWASGHLGAVDSPGFDGTEYTSEVKP